MKLTLATAPSSEPLSVAEAKTHLRITASDDDTYIGSLITVAREAVEDWTGRSLITQTWDYYLDRWPRAKYIELPRGAPLQSVTHIKYTDSDGDETTVSSDDYDVDTDSEPGRIVLAYNAKWPTATLRPMNPIVVRFVAGFGDNSTDVPETYRHAIRLLVADYYEQRQDIAVSGAIPKSIGAIEALLQTDRVWTL